MLKIDNSLAFLKSNNENSLFLHMLLIMLKFAVSLGACVICLMIAFSCLKARAAEDGIHLEESYTVHWYAFDINENIKKTYNYDFTISNGHPMFFVYHEHNGGYSLGEYIKSEETAYNMSNTGDHTGIPVQGSYVVGNLESDKIDTELNFPMDETDRFYLSMLSKFYGVGSNLGSLTFNCNCYVFDSLESATAYYRDGDGSGILQRPPIPDNDDDYHHDFSKDTYDADIPIPELTNFSHNGFTVNNARDDLFISIIVKSEFLGAKHYEFINNNVDFGNNSYDICADTSWVYASHYYNIADLSDIAVNESKINIKELWGVDNEDALVKDFKKWSKEYPSHTKLRDYSFWKHSNSGYMVSYKQRHLYYYDSDRSDSVQLRASGQAQTTYYVRFYDKNMNYSKWIGYTFRDGQTFNGKQHDPELGTGEVIPDQEGNPTIPNPNKGTQDPNTGDVDYSYGSGGKSTFDSSDLWATIQNLVNNLGAIPELIGEVLSFLPQWVLYMIAAGIAACVILRFVGR